MTDQEINEAVARKLGWVYSEKYKAWKCPSFLESTYSQMVDEQYPDYCHSIAAAWEIVEKHRTINSLNKMENNPDAKYEFMLVSDDGEWKCGWQYWHYDEHVWVDETNEPSSADTAPMAICLAFLKLSYNDGKFYGVIQNPNAGMIIATTEPAKEEQC